MIVRTKHVRENGTLLPTAVILLSLPCGCSSHLVQLSMCHSPYTTPRETTVNIISRYYLYKSVHFSIPKQQLTVQSLRLLRAFQSFAVLIRNRFRNPNETTAQPSIYVLQRMHYRCATIFSLHTSCRQLPFPFPRPSPAPPHRGGHRIPRRRHRRSV